ncbi:hypothetical protein MMC06_005013 [Schaereria dolodes]|nr:hypothetical protein [Schaereria dolodes]
MPPTRRSKASTNTRSQPPLSFSSRTNKVTKPSIPQTSKTSKPSQPITTTPSQVLNAADEITTPSPAPEDVDKQIEEQPTTAELAIRQQVQAVKATDLSPKGSEAAEKAKGVTDAGIKRYWKAKEEGRKAARGG